PAAGPVPAGCPWPAPRRGARPFPPPPGPSGSAGAANSGGHRRRRTGATCGRKPGLRGRPASPRERGAAATPPRSWAFPLLLLAGAGQRPGDYHAVDLGRPVVDAEGPHVAVQPFQQVAAHQARRPADLNAAVDDPADRLGDEDLAHGGLLTCL